MIFGMHPLGIFHTAVSLIAVAAGITSLVQHKAIGWDTPVGKVYVVGTAMTCLTGFGIFNHEVSDRRMP